MDKNIKNLKLKLSIISIIILFIINLLIWVGFLSYKYYNSYNDTINKEKTYYNNIKKLDFKSLNFKNLKENDNYENLFKSNFIILDNSWNIRYNNSPYLDQNFILDIKNQLKLSSSKEDDWFLFTKYNLANNIYIVVISFVSYPVETYINDLIKFWIFLLLLSVFIYLLIYKFVSYLVAPIQENMKKMKYFIQVASHELKTPLSTIKSSVSLLKETESYDEETVNDIENETIKSAELIKTLIDLTNLNKDAIKEDIHISEIFYEIVKEFDEKIKEKKIKLKINLKNDISLQVNKYYIYILISNLISNSIKYNKEKWDIDIIIDWNYFSIKDTWCWIEKGNLSKIFDIFYRELEHRSSEWLWLWLSLVKSICDLYKWKIEIISDKWIWSEFICKI